jgi:hypothetical protein
MAEPVRTSAAHRPGIAGLGAVVLVAAAALAAEGAPRGRVVRVERTIAATVPRICAMGGGTRGQNMCFGDPRVGDRIAVIDMAEKRVRGEYVIESVSEATELSSLGLCISSGVKSVRGSYAAGAEEGGHVMGLRGARLSRKLTQVLTSVPAPSGRTDETVELAIDADGNGHADLVLTQYPCDANGVPASGGDGRCFDTYLEQRGGLRRVQQDILRACP